MYERLYPYWSFHMYVRPLGGLLWVHIPLTWPFSLILSIWAPLEWSFMYGAPMLSILSHTWDDTWPSLETYKHLCVTIECVHSCGTHTSDTLPNFALSTWVLIECVHSNGTYSLLKKKNSTSFDALPSRTWQINLSSRTAGPT